MIILRMLMGRGWSHETTTMCTLVQGSGGSPTETKTPFQCLDKIIAIEKELSLDSTETARAV